MKYQVFVNQAHILSKCSLTVRGRSVGRLTNCCIMISTNIRPCWNPWYSYVMRCTERRNISCARINKMLPLPTKQFPSSYLLITQSLLNVDSPFSVPYNMMNFQIKILSWYYYNIIMIMLRYATNLNANLKQCLKIQFLRHSDVLQQRSLNECWATW